MKQSQKLNLTFIVKRVVAITALLALFEVAFIYFYMNGKHSKKGAPGNTSELKQPPVGVVKDSTPKLNIVTRQEAPIREAINTEAINTTPPVSTPPASTSPVNTPPVTKPVVTAASSPAKVSKPLEKKQIDTIKKKLQQPVPEPVKIAQRELTHQEMVQLLNDINAKKASLNNQTKCIQIRKTQSSNIDNGFEIATFLKQNGFIISGREVVNSNNNGISIDASESCIKLTIGTL